MTVQKLGVVGQKDGQGGPECMFGTRAPEPCGFPKNKRNNRARPSLSTTNCGPNYHMPTPK